jgi:hypothetical protein
MLPLPMSLPDDRHECIDKIRAFAAGNRYFYVDGREPYGLRER